MTHLLKPICAALLLSTLAGCAGGLGRLPCAEEDYLYVPDPNDSSAYMPICDPSK